MKEASTARLPAAGSPLRVLRRGSGALATRPAPPMASNKVDLGTPSKPSPIVLYTLVPSGEARPLMRSPQTRLRYALGNAVDHVDWRVRRRFAFKPYRFERFRCSNIGDAAVRATVAQQTTAGLAAEVPIEEIQWGRLTADRIARINAEGSPVVIAGGGYLAADSSGELMPFVEHDFELFERLEAPLVSFGIGLNVNRELGFASERPSLTRQAIELLGRFADRHALIAVRDAFTCESLARASGRDILVIPDPVFFMDPAPALRGAARAAPGRRPVVGLNFAFHGPHVAGNLARHFPRYLSILKKLRNRTGCRFVYFAHSDPERLVYRLLRAEGLVDERADADSPAALLSAYGRVDVVIGEMMHCAIMAMAAGTPVVSVGYDVKHRGLFDLLGLPHWHLDPLAEPLEVLEERTAALLSDWSAERATLVERLAALEPSYRAFTAQFAELLARLRPDVSSQPERLS
ncbi:MAG: polysaccharide pyruvyl transferase family protein [Tistlia sp.]|uniref:polysaccharide pyruvyl transferase family protein n=1 Tax=Tistlia sp. TaxID=3057121 RepID=UPI0034A2DB37